MKAGPLIAVVDSNPNAEGSGGELVPFLPGITLRRPPLSRSPLSTLYRGWDRAHRREVIVKVQRATEDPVVLSRFGREAAVMQRLHHPSIVSLYLYHPGDPAKNDPAALVLEYIPGPTLALLVSEGGFLTPARAAKLVEEIAEALDCIHGIGVVHRDVKPSNILVPRRGPAKLTDFGVARIDEDLPLTVMGDILGTIEYASPEQVHGNGVIDTRSDVYSLAAVTYFVLTGTPPFRAADSSTQAQLSVMHRQVFAEPPPLRLHRADLTPAMEAAVLRGLAKAPADRYESAGQLAAALRAAVTSDAEPEQIATEASARRTGAIAGALASAALLLGGFVLWKENERTPSASPSPAVTAQTHRAVPIPSAPVPISSAPISSAALPKPPVKTAAATAKALAVPAKPLMSPLETPAAPAAKPTRIARTPKPVKVAAPLNVAAHSPARPTTKRLAAAFQRRPLISKRVLSTRLHAPRSLPPVHGFLPPVQIAERRPAPRLLPGLLPEIPPGVVSPPAVMDATPTVIAPVLAAAPLPGAAPPPPTIKVGWYTVSGWIAVAEQAPPQKPALVQAASAWIKVDGQPSPALAQGQWAELTTGKHTVIFQPLAGLGVGSKTWDIDIAPAAHLNQQLPLPSESLPVIPIHLRTP